MHGRMQRWMYALVNAFRDVCTYRCSRVSVCTWGCARKPDGLVFKSRPFHVLAEPPQMAGGTPSMLPLPQ